MDAYSSSKNWETMETEQGIFTQDGHWYHITREEIEQYVPGLLDINRLEEMLKEAGYWASSTASISLFLYVALVFLSVNTWFAAILALAFYVFWYFNKSAFVYPELKWIVAFISNNGFVYLGMGIALTYFGINGFYTEAILGFCLFFLLKVGLLKLLIDRFFTKKSLMLQDRVFNMILIRRAMKEGLKVHRIREMEDELLNNIYKKNTGEN